MLASYVPSLHNGNHKIRSASPCCPPQQILGFHSREKAEIKMEIF